MERCAIPITHTLSIRVNDKTRKVSDQTYTIREPNSRHTVVCRGFDICNFKTTGMKSSATAKSVKILQSKTGYQRTPLRLHRFALYSVVPGVPHWSGRPIPEKTTHTARAIIMIWVARRSQI